MTIVDKGRGVPIILVPGIQGRWEYMRPAVDALARRHRAIIYPLLGEPGARRPVRVPASLDELVEQLRRVLDDRQIDKAVVCGISFGGVIALRFAARHPERTAALVLASVPGPGWRLRSSHRAYTRFPRLAAPLFLAGAPGRLRREIVSAFPDPVARRTFVRSFLSMLMTTPVSPVRMAERAKLIDGIDLVGDCARLTAPTLVITGEPGLDHVVPVGSSWSYAHAIAKARSVILEATGHLGCVTRPDAFAIAVSAFLDDLGITSSGEHAA